MLEGRKRKFQMDRSILKLLIPCLLILLPIAFGIAAGIRHQFRYRNFLYALSDATVYCSQNNCLKAEQEDETVRVSEENAYALYFLFTKKQAKPRSSAPQEPPAMVLTYGNGAVMECWRQEMEESARRTYGIFWRFTSPEGKVWMFDTDDLSISILQRRTALSQNEPW